MKCTRQRHCRLHPRPVGLHLLLFILVMNILMGLYLFNIPPNDVISPVGQARADEIVVLPTPTATPTPVDNSDEQKEIEDYIKTIFGKDAKIAIAVSHVECNPKNKAYPKCVYHTDHEYSVGIFQINLYNKSHWIHAKKVPGETMEEKIEWLKNPYHNTLIAFKIFNDSGWNPWAGYTSGRYLNNL